MTASDRACYFWGDDPRVNAPVADFPVRKMVGAHHFVADLTLPYGRVLHDYLQPI